MNQWSNKSMNECMNQWTIEQMNQGANESMNFANLILQNSSDSFNLFGGFEVQIELLLQSRAHFVSFICQKCSDPFSFFCDCKCKTISLKYSIMRILPTSPSKIAPICSDTFSFFAISTCKSSSRYSLVHILPTLSSKSVPGVTDFNIWSANRALPTVWCAFFRPPLLKVIWGLQFFFTFEVQIRLLPRSCTLFANLIFQKCSGIVSF